MKDNKKLVIGIIIGLLLTSTIGYAAYKYQATEVGYTPENENFDVDNVSDAIKELYDKITSGPTMVPARIGDTHKGIVYLDPTDLNKGCDEKSVTSATGTKIGCMKWYVYKEDNNNYYLLLDHNTTARISLSSAADQSGKLSLLQSRLTSDTTGWIASLQPGFIPAQDVADIVAVGKSGTVANNFDVSTARYVNWFYFNSGNNDNDNNGKNGEGYGWLFNNLVGCTTYGCDVLDNNNYTQGDIADTNGNVKGYYTSGRIASSCGVPWRIGSSGYMNCYGGSENDYGIRPVITISKSIIK